MQATSAAHVADLPDIIASVCEQFEHHPAFYGIATESEYRDAFSPDEIGEKHEEARAILSRYRDHIQRVIDACPRDLAYLNPLVAMRQELKKIASGFARTDETGEPAKEKNINAVRGLIHTATIEWIGQLDSIATDYEVKQIVRTVGESRTADHPPWWREIVDFDERDETSLKLKVCLAGKEFTEWRRVEEEQFLAVRALTAKESGLIREELGDTHYRSLKELSDAWEALRKVIVFPKVGGQKKGVPPVYRLQKPA